MTRVKDVLAVCNAFLDAASFPADDPNGLWHGSSDQPVKRVGLALEPPFAIAGWRRASRLDAAWLHRPWPPEGEEIPEGFPIIAHHLSFDERLTPGWSPVIATYFGLRHVEPLGEKNGRPIGMIGQVAKAPLRDWVAHLDADFGGHEALAGSLPARAPVEKIAFAGAFWPELVAEAAARGAHLFVTGQLRPPGLETLPGLGMAALATGHERAERWGLQVLGAFLELQFPDVVFERLPFL